MKYTVYSDGGYLAHKDAGAFAYIILDENFKVIEKRAYFIRHESNNRAELKAIIAAVHRLPSDADYVRIYSDSQYALNTLAGWWKRRKNKDLFEIWKKVQDAHKSMLPSYKWVKGHDGDGYNEMCDQMCTSAMESEQNIILL